MQLVDVYKRQGLHCSTADVYREGECLDYFPNRVEDPTLVRPEMWK